MWLQLEPGEHEPVVRVALPRKQVGPQTVVDLDSAEYRRVIRLAAGETHQEILTAEITAVPRPDRPELAAFRACLR
ncbi:hypothetical protein [Glycomyces tritici]|uniref:DUF167 domain-containing protein n=1 Tax=Glycomyces tritici TaxID=2665176 RepID=A0ABT7YXR4_9ACTN|nr:hypothetical protein [Glycomyces tritici]MDN3243139.1 hypothetical protein [Glycomyces tritici]